MLPYDSPVKGTVLCVNHKENCLYVRPGNMDEIGCKMEKFLFEIKQMVLCPAIPNQINIGEQIHFFHFRSLEKEIYSIQLLEFLIILSKLLEQL